MFTLIDTLKADSVEILKQNWLAKAITVNQVFPHLALMYSAQE